MISIPPQLRLVRLAMVLIICVLTVFLYASYYASPDLSIPNRIHIVNGGAGEFDATAGQLINEVSGTDAVRIRNAGGAVEQQQPTGNESRSPTLLQLDSGKCANIHPFIIVLTSVSK